MADTREEEEEEEDGSLDSEEEEEQVSRKQRNKQKKKLANKKPRFLDNEADDDDDSETDMVDTKADLEDSKESKAMSATLRGIEHRRQTAVKFGDTSLAEETAARLAERYKSEQRLGTSGQSQTTSSALTMETARFVSYRPTSKDPKLFIVKVRPGEENEICITLFKKYCLNRTQKFQEVQTFLSKKTRKIELGAELEIFSVCAPGTKGTLYVEAMKKESVEAALRSVNGVFFGKGIGICKVEEMTDVLRVEVRKEVVRKGDFVRVKGLAKYKDDLAQVLSVLDAGNRLWVRLLPRLDLAQLGVDSQGKRAVSGLELKAPPAAKPFLADEVRNAGGEVRREVFPPSGKVLDCFNSDFFENGLLLLELQLRQAKLVDAAQCLQEELDVFTFDSALPSPTKRKQQVGVSAFSLGDWVLVVRGADVGLEGVIESVSLVKQTALLKSSLLNDKVEVSLLDLVKRFRVGDRVEVTTGLHAGKVGDVIALLPHGANPKVLLLASDNTEELEVLNAELRLTSNATSSAAPRGNSLGGYALFDLLQLDQNLAAIVIHVGSQLLRVLTQGNEEKEILPSKVRANRNAQSKDAVASDSRNATLHCNDPVSVVAGLHTGVQGTIKRIHGQLLFLHTKEALDCIKVVRAKDTRLLGAPDKARSTLAAPVLKRKHDPWMGKTVRIVRGDDKNFLGRVVEGGSHELVKVELNARQRVMIIKRENLVLVEEVAASAGEWLDDTSSRRLASAQAAPSTPIHHSSHSVPVQTTTTTTTAAAALVGFKKGDKVKVIDTGENVTVFSVVDERDVAIMDSKGEYRIVSVQSIVYA